MDGAFRNVLLMSNIARKMPMEGISSKPTRLTEMRPKLRTCDQCCASRVKHDMAANRAIGIVGANPDIAPQIEYVGTLIEFECMVGVRVATVVAKFQSLVHGDVSSISRYLRYRQTLILPNAGLSVEARRGDNDAVTDFPLVEHTGSQSQNRAASARNGTQAGSDAPAKIAIYFHRAAIIDYECS